VTTGATSDELSATIRDEMAARGFPGAAVGIRLTEPAGGTWTADLQSVSGRIPTNREKRALIGIVQRLRSKHHLLT
jgi:hypothetical protein